MAKARRLLEDQLSHTDLVIELCDARIPFSSRNPDLDKMIQEKKRILILNKADLADPDSTSKWIKYFRNNGITAIQANANRYKSKDAIGVIETATKETIQKYAERGVRKTIRAMVAGVPNVGKSTYINRLHGGNIAETGDRPGVTKNNRWIRITPYLELLDTPGLLWPRLDNQISARKLCYIGSIKDDVIDLSSLTIHLLEDLKKIAPESIKERFHISDISSEGVELLDEVCKGRGFLLKGGAYDYERCYSVVLDEFRAGKLGRITLETPE